MTSPGRPHPVISAPQAAPDAPYVRSLSVGHRPWNRSWLAFGDFTRAGSLDFTLGTTPNTAWASAPDAVPPSDTTGGGNLLAATGPASDGLVLTPGGSGEGTLTLTNLGASPVTVDWTARAPSEVTVEPSSGALTVPAAGSAQAKVSAAAGEKEGSYPVTFALTDHDGGKGLGTDPVNAYVFATRVPLDPTKTVASLTLPATGAAGSAHVFAVGFAP